MLVNNDTAISTASTGAMTLASEVNKEETVVPQSLSSGKQNHVEANKSFTKTSASEPEHLSKTTTESRTQNHLSMPMNQDKLPPLSFPEDGIDTELNLNCPKDQKNHPIDSIALSHTGALNGYAEMKNATVEAIRFRPDSTQPVTERNTRHHGTAEDKGTHSNKDQVEPHLTSSRQETGLDTKNNTSPPNSISEFSDEISPQAVVHFPIGDDHGNGTTESEDEAEIVSETETHQTNEMPDIKSNQDRINCKNTHQMGSSGEEMIDDRANSSTAKTKTSERDEVGDSSSIKMLNAPNIISQTHTHVLSSLKKDTQCNDNCDIDDANRNIPVPQCNSSEATRNKNECGIKTNPVDSSSMDDVLRSLPPSSLSVSSGNETQTTNESPVRLNTAEIKESDCNEEVERIRNDASSLDRMKLNLYMEAMKVHRGESGERLFADYWDTLGRFLAQGNSARSDDNSATNGVEAVIATFLCTRKLRKLHNSYVKMLLKQCLQVRVLRDRIRDHIPLRWKNQVKKVSNKRDRSGESKSSMTDVDGLLLMRKDFGIHSAAFGNSGSQPIKLETYENESENHNDSNQLPSARLPGTLEIDHISRYITEKDGYCLSQSAQWLAVISIRDYLEKILQKAIDYASAGKTNGGSKKRRRLTSFDFIQVIDGNVSGSVAGADSFPRKTSRIAWEHFTSNSCNTVQPRPHMELNSIQNSINSMFSKGPIGHETANMSRKIFAYSEEGKRTNGDSRNGQGKDFSAMKARKTKKSSSPPAFTLPENHLENILNEPMESGKTNYGSSLIQNTLDQPRSNKEQRLKMAFPSTDTDPSVSPLPEIDVTPSRPSNSTAYFKPTGNAIQNLCEQRTSSACSNGSGPISRPSSASSINTNIGGGRGRGSKDLQAMQSKRK